MTSQYVLHDPRCDSPAAERPPMRKGFDPMTGRFPDETRRGGEDLLADPRDGQTSEIVFWPDPTGA